MPNDLQQAPMRDMDAEMLADAQNAGPSWWQLLQALPGLPKRAANALVSASLTEMLKGAGHTIASGATAAGDVATGKLQMRNPLTGQLTDEGIRRAQDMYLGTQMTGAPVAAATVPANSLGTLIGKGARTWNPELAETARVAERMGVSPENVWKETGYSGQGFADKMMRSEIPDVFSGINDLPLSMKPAAKLGQVLHHPELYEAYPNLANTVVAKMNMPDKNIIGGYYPLNGGIILNESRLARMTPEDIKSTLLHEVGHKIEHNEGFARGGGVQEFLPKDFDSRYAAASQKMQEAIKGTGIDLITLLQKHGIPTSEAGNVVKNFARMPDTLPSAEALSKYSPQLGSFIQEMFANKKLRDMTAIIRRDMLPLEDMRAQAVENYKRLAGEVHQRAVQSRSEMIAPELRESPPWFSFDRPRQQHIVRFDAMPAQNMVLPPEVASNFSKLAELQRGKPEQAMLKIQDAMGGGVLFPLVEHAGDLTHRMTTLAKYGSAGFDEIKPKVNTLIKTLAQPYGFEREMRENITATASHRKIPENVLQKNIDDSLATYAKEHAALPVYNEAQRVARDIAVAIGQKQFPKALNGLYKLQNKLKTPAEWDKYALEHTVEGYPFIQGK